MSNTVFILVYNHPQFGEKVLTHNGSRGAEKVAARFGWEVKEVSR